MSLHQTLKTGVVLALLAGIASCSVVATRPDQELSDASAALKSAKEVQADTMAPGTYRKAIENFDKGRREYRFKNYIEAKSYLIKAKSYAEDAEFTALKSGTTRQETPVDPLQGEFQPPPMPSPSPTPSDTPQPLPSPSPSAIPSPDPSSSPSPHP